VTNERPHGDTLVQEFDPGEIISTVRHSVELTPPRRHIGLAWKIGWTITGVLFAVAAILTVLIVVHAYNDTAHARDDAVAQRNFLAEQGVKGIQVNACMTYLSNRVDSATGSVLVSIVKTLSLPLNSPERTAEFAHTQDLAGQLGNAIAERDAAAVQAIASGDLPPQCPNAPPPPGG